MSHKVNPISFRLVNVKNWQSKWFTKRNMASNIAEDIAIRLAIVKKYARTAGINRIEIIRDPDSINIHIYSSKPGIIIGRSGQGINDLRAFIVKHVDSFRTASSNKVPKIKIESFEVKNPEACAQLVAENIASQIERRIPYKRAIKQSIAKAMEAKVKGVKIQASGRLGGAEIARTEKYGESSVPLGRIRADIDYGQTTAMTTYGTIGVKVWIYKGDKIFETAE